MYVLIQGFAERKMEFISELLQQSLAFHLERSKALKQCSSNAEEQKDNIDHKTEESKSKKSEQPPDIHSVERTANQDRPDLNPRSITDNVMSRLQAIVTTQEELNGAEKKHEIPETWQDDPMAPEINPSSSPWEDHLTNIPTVDWEYGRHTDGIWGTVASIDYNYLSKGQDSPDSASLHDNFPCQPPPWVTHMHPPVQRHTYQGLENPLYATPSMHLPTLIEYPHSILELVEKLEQRINDAITVIQGLDSFM